MKHPYPINIDLSRKAVAVVGGGAVATRKIRALLDAAANVTVISPELAPEIDTSQVTWRQKRYETGDIQAMDMIIACTDDVAVNAQITQDATHFQLVNNASDKTQSDFFNVAKLEDETLLLTVSTKGKSPATAKRIKQTLRRWLDDQHWFKGEDQ